MNVPFTPAQADAAHALQCRARALNVTCELHFDLAWNVILLVDGQEFKTIADAVAHLSTLEAAK